jgi:hypothetical protein
MRGSRWRRRGCRRLRRLGPSPRSRRSRRSGRGGRRKKRERIHISLLVGSHANAEIDIRLRPVGLAARAHRRDRRSLCHRVALPNSERPEVLERHRVAVGGTNRDRLSAFWDRPGEGDVPGGRRQDVGPKISGHVDSAVLATGIRILSEDERPQHLSLYRPRPGLRRGRYQAGHDDQEENHSPHTSNSLFSILTTDEGQDSVRFGCCQSCLHGACSKRAVRGRSPAQRDSLAARFEA